VKNKPEVSNIIINFYLKFNNFTNFTKISDRPI